MSFSGQTCDSGVVNWTASPVSAFGPVVQPLVRLAGNLPGKRRAAGKGLMGATGLEPVTSSLSSWRSPN